MSSLEILAELVALAESVVSREVFTCINSSARKSKDYFAFLSLYVANKKVRAIGLKIIMA